MEFLIVLTIVVTIIAFMAIVGPAAAESEKQHLSTGKKIPDEDELRVLCVDQLITDYTVDELEELADIAISHLKDEPKVIRCQWEDLLRRIYMASDEKLGVC